MSTLYLVRTGRTRLSHEGRLQGRSDLPLTADGRRDALDAAGRLARVGVPALYASPLRRSRETANVIGDSLGPGVEVVHHAGLIDVDLGSWTGRTTAELRALEPKGFDAFFRYPTTWTFPAGEWMADAERRAFAALLEVADASDEHAAVVVTHELIIRLVLLRLRRLEGTAMWDPHVRPGSVTLLRVTSEGLELPTPLEDLFRAAERRQADG